jgi:hypothetical protein
MRPIRDIRSDADLAEVIRRCELRWRAQEQGLREHETEALLARGLDTAEAQLRSIAALRRRPTSPGCPPGTACPLPDIGARPLTTIARLARPLVLAILSSALLPAAIHAADDPVATAVDEAVRPLMTEYDVPGIAVAVTVDGRPSFFSYGVAAKASGAPVTQDTLFEIGSISKTFTATLAGDALAQGKISLDDHPGTYMPELHGSAVDKATLLDLGTFTAGGLPLQVPDTVTSDAGMVDYLRSWKPDAAPGEQRQYSNVSIGLFGHIAGLAMQGDVADLLEPVTRCRGCRSLRLVPEAGLDAEGAAEAVGDGAGGFGVEAFDHVGLLQPHRQPDPDPRDPRRVDRGEGALHRGDGPIPAPVPFGPDRGLAAGRARRGRRRRPAGRPVAPFLGQAQAAGQPGHDRADRPVLDPVGPRRRHRGR